MNILPKESNWQSVLGQALSQAMEKQAQQRQSEQDYMMKAMITQKMKDIPMQRAEEALEKYGLEPDAAKAGAWGGSRAGAKVVEEAIAKKRLAEVLGLEAEELNQDAGAGTQGMVPQPPVPQDMQPQAPMLPGQVDPTQQQPGEAETLGMFPAFQQTEKEREEGEDESNLRTILSPRKPVDATFENYITNEQASLDDKYNARRRSILNGKSEPRAKEAAIHELEKRKALEEVRLEKGIGRSERAFKETEPYRKKLSEAAKNADTTIKNTDIIMRLLEAGDLNDPSFVKAVENLDPTFKDALFSNDQQTLRAILPRLMDKETTEAIKGNLNQNEFTFLTSTLPNDKLQSEVIKRLVLYKRGEAEVALVRDRLAGNSIESNKGAPPNNLNSIVDSKLDRYKNAIGRAINRQVKSKKVPPTGSLMSGAMWGTLGVVREALPLGLGLVGGWFGGTLGGAIGVTAGSLIKGDTTKEALAQGAATYGGGKALGWLGQAGTAVLGKFGVEGVKGAASGATSGAVKQALRRAGVLKSGGKLLEKVGFKKAGRSLIESSGRKIAAQTAIKTAAEEATKATAKVAAVKTAQTATKAAVNRVGSTGKFPAGVIFDHKGQLIKAGKVLENSGEMLEAYGDYLKRIDWSEVDRTQRKLQVAKIRSLPEHLVKKYMAYIGRKH